MSNKSKQFHSASVFRTTLSCMADGVLVADVEGRLTLMNPVAEALTGWNIADAKGQPFGKVFAIRCEERPDDVGDPIARVLHEGCVVRERRPLVLTSRMGRTIPIAYSACPCAGGAEGQMTGVVLVFRDESRTQAQ